MGRRRELTEARRLLSSVRLLSLTGAPGVGKTRLALRVAAEMRRAFPDGVHLVELDALSDPGLLAQTVAAAFHLGDASADPAARLQKYVRDKRLLLVLDNCEHLTAACAALVATLLASAPGLRVLATSRHVLEVTGEHILRVPPLTVPDHVDAIGRSSAVSLFVDRASAVNPQFVVDEQNREQVLAICRRLDGVPLALELAAAWTPTLTPAEILERLDDRFTLLAKSSRTTPPRHQTLAATLDWSYRLCPPAEQLLWTRLSVFAGGFDLEAAEAVGIGGGIARSQILGLVAGLVDKSILVAHQDARGRARYRMLETIRQYGVDLLGASGEAERIRGRHADYYRQLARRFAKEGFGPRQVEWIHRLRAEHANIRAALHFALTAPGRASTATEIAASLREFWYGSGFVREGYQWLQRALTVDVEPTRRRGHALWSCAYLGANLGEIDAVNRMLPECAELAEKLDDPMLRAGHALSAGFVAMHRYELVEATNLLQASASQYQRVDDPGHLADSLILLALAGVSAGDERAAQAAERSLEHCRAHGASWMQCYALYAVAVHKWRHGACRQATSLLQEAIRLRSGLPDWATLAHLVEALAWCASGDDQPVRAVRLLGAATTIWRRSGTDSEEILPFQAVNDEVTARARAALGADRFHAELKRGERLSVEQAISEALEEQAPDTTSRGGPPRARAPLTRRQTQIAELVARGMTNKEIAARLTIAQRTAEAHVENVLTKLGFTSRAQIAAWVAEQRDSA